MNEAAERHGFIVVYPSQPSHAHPQRCWNWYDRGHQKRDAGEPAQLAALTRQVIESHHADPARIYVAGLSAGGAMATILGEAYPDLFAAVGVHSGLPARAANDLGSALRAMSGTSAHEGLLSSRVPVIVFHGDADTTVHPSNADAILASHSASGHVVTQEHVTAPDGTSAMRTHHADKNGRVMAEHWVLHGGNHAWSGGCVNHTLSSARGPSASDEMLRFFKSHAL
jgi:poly(hydroxyalkanoate) depolymerase family esterase